jgi:hypothetical protein
MPFTDNAATAFMQGIVMLQTGTAFEDVIEYIAIRSHKPPLRKDFKTFLGYCAEMDKYVRSLTQSDLVKTRDYLKALLTPKTGFLYTPYSLTFKEFTTGEESTVTVPLNVASYASEIQGFVDIPSDLQDEDGDLIDVTAFDLAAYREVSKGTRSKPSKDFKHSTVTVLTKTYKPYADDRLAQAEILSDFITSSTDTPPLITADGFQGAEDDDKEMLTSSLPENPSKVLKEVYRRVEDGALGKGVPTKLMKAVQDLMTPDGQLYREENEVQERFINHLSKIYKRLFDLEYKALKKA